MTRPTPLQAYNLHKRKGLSMSEIAKQFGLTRNVILGIVARHRNAIAADGRDLEILKALAAGTPTDWVAKEFQIGERYVKALARELEEAA